MATVAHSTLFVNSVEKAFRVLRAFQPDRRRLSLSQISRFAEIDMSAAQRFTHTLLQLQVLQKIPGTKSTSSVLACWTSPISSFWLTSSLAEAPFFYSGYPSRRKRPLTSQHSMVRTSFFCSALSASTCLRRRSWLAQDSRLSAPLPVSRCFPLSRRLRREQFSRRLIASSTRHTRSPTSIRYSNVCVKFAKLAMCIRRTSYILARLRQRYQSWQPTAHHWALSMRL